MSTSHAPEIEELLGAYALDALEPEEAALVDAHLATCARCRQELTAHIEVAGRLGSVGQDAPPGVWDKIAASLPSAPPQPVLRRVPSELAAVVPPANAAHRRARTRVLVGCSGLVAAVVIVVLGIGVVRLDNRVNHVSTQLHAAQTPTVASVGAALSAPGSTQLALAPLAGGPALAQVVIGRDGVGYLYDSRMPTLAADRTYELWGIVDDVRVPYGVLGAEPSKVTEFVAQGDTAALAVTEERAGGVVSSTQTPVAAGNLPRR
jgi:anti-sigma factor RsiW